MQDSARYPSLQGQGVFITGGATGIGAALVRAFNEQGARVTFADINAQAGSALEAELGGAAQFVLFDLTDTLALQRAITDADNRSSLSVLINNAANDMRHSPDETSPEQWRECMAINLDAAFFAARACAPLMAGHGGGSIINFSSINALLGPSNMPGYVTAKAGLIGMTKALAKDYGERLVRVNAILPGWVVTERQLQTWLTPEEESSWMEQVALPKRLLPENVARLALFLAASDSDMITGQSFTIDGGRT
ncbi:MAG: SDR family oxidoreductase [Proteobacteria bacterium]|jgi:NAD(P)-dependent dehydrogenase (short-subunit alcohol dehydrogenase family)|nr:SDR family oxidoreductase [Pseudomonadota bacterium]